jgi:hypothetical protein
MLSLYDRLLAVMSYKKRPTEVRESEAKYKNKPTEIKELEVKIRSPKTRLASMLVTPAAFSIPELLENILRHLPPIDILRHQRVCRHWHTVITTSTSLQQALFFRAKVGAQEPQFNPLLQSLFPPMFDSKTVIPSMYEHYIDQIYEMSWYKNIERRKNVLREDASWQRMFPIQPPAKIDKLLFQWSCGCAGGSKSVVLLDKAQREQEPGAKMGFVFDVLVAMLDAYSGEYFFVLWDVSPRDTGFGNCITMYESHGVECFGDPFPVGRTETTGLRIRDYPAQSGSGVASPYWDDIHPENSSNEW